MARLSCAFPAFSVVLVGILQPAAAVAVLNFDGSDDPVSRPVSKVITLLKDMLKQLEKESEEDEAIYSKLSCWCRVNDKEKTQSIAAAEAKIQALTTKVEELTASSARLNSEIKNHEKEVAENQGALDRATAIREKALSSFNSEEKDLLESISALKAAVTVLSKHHRSFLQLPGAGIADAAGALRRVMQKHPGMLTKTQRSVATSLIQAPQDYFDAAPTFKQSYAPQSGEVYGILRNMQETFEANLGASQWEELENQKAYEDLKAAKLAEIKAGQEQIDVKTLELADTDEKNALAKVDIKDTKGSLSADEQFLQMLKDKCKMTDKEWKERQKTRNDEKKAVSQALKVLSADDAHDTFTRTFNPVLLQTAAGEAADRRASASKVLAKVAQRVRSPRMSALAYQVKLDAFERVKKAIADMVAELLKEKTDEIKHKDFCVEELDTNQLQVERENRQKQDLTARIADAERMIKTLAQELDVLKAEVKEMQVQLKRTGEDREIQNKEFQATVKDQRETCALLKKALDFLKAFYSKKASVVLLQQGPVGPPPPPGFETYKHNAGSGGVMSLIEKIISDAKAMVAEAIKGEADSQAAYESFVKDTNASIEAKGRSIVELSEAKAKGGGELEQTKADKDATISELEQLSSYSTQLHQSCDFVLKNFELRQQARDKEVDALRQAKAILSGAKFEEDLLQES